jgi:hypothetical protein
MIRSHAAECRVNGWTTPESEDHALWMYRLYHVDTPVSEQDIARGMDYISAEKEEWEGYAKAFSCFGYSEESTNPVLAYKAIQEIREDWAGHELPTDAEWWVGNLEANDTPFTLEAIELALAA